MILGAAFEGGMIDPTISAECSSRNRWSVVKVQVVFPGRILPVPYYLTNKTPLAYNTTLHIKHRSKQGQKVHTGIILVCFSTGI